jgi:NADH-quinone oxidoreductase subunit A
VTVAQYLPILFLAVLAVLFAVLSFAASKLLAPRLPTVPKQQPYESGIVPGKEPPRRFPVRFYLVAMIFIVFDIELIFLYPYAIVHRELGMFGLVAIVIFSASVFESFLYLLSKGAFDWGPLKRFERPSHMRSGDRTSATTVRRVGLEGRHRPEETQIMIDEGLIESGDPAVPTGAH